MESRQITNVQQALQTVAGVSPVNFGRRGFDDINIRGFRSTESILVDGLVQSPGMWAKLQPYGYERFEVLKGSASVLYGQVQPGGIVNAVSKRPKKEAINEVGVEVGSFGHA
ncbi:TonB-dependent receptor plug domain-containing protein [Acidovorax sp. 59]|uniref:TonB-dependent receptor plug domain-containing protein n=1 Tax=unclassified Acidovorax TaxID=2684926 RepID=UPI000C5B50D1|nr:TonB-dependent receptor-like protein [Acidovorax sp. 59]PKW04367.1 TonB-dependent receptor-like protein [Acidovorax sp. 30]